MTDTSAKAADLAGRLSLLDFYLEVAERMLPEAAPGFWSPDALARGQIRMARGNVRDMIFDLVFEPANQSRFDA